MLVWIYVVTLKDKTGSYVIKKKKIRIRHKNTLMCPCGANSLPSDKIQLEGHSSVALPPPQTSPGPAIHGSQV